MIGASAANELIKQTRELGCASAKMQISEIDGDVLALVFVAVEKPTATAASTMLELIEKIADQDTPAGEKCKLVEQGHHELIRFANRCMINEDN